MATAAVPNRTSYVEPGKRLLTAADLAALPEQLPSGPVSYELRRGRLVPMSPPGARHGNLQVQLGAALLNQGEKKGFGKAFAEVGVVLQRKPDHVLGPDAAFVTHRSFPIVEAPEGYLATIPELVVEIRSKNDTTAEVTEKVDDYLQAGVQLVWIVDPATETVAEHRPNSPAKILTSADTLDCEGIIPGFRLSLADLYRE